MQSNALRAGDGSRSGGSACTWPFPGAPLRFLSAFPARPINLFKLLGQPKDGDVAKTQLLQFARRGVKLASASVNQNQIRQVYRPSFDNLARGAMCAQVSGGRIPRGSERSFSLGRNA